MSRSDCPPDCFQGSTDFYATPASDPFTPSYLEAGCLADNVGIRRDGTIPPWIDPESEKSPSEQYVEWFNGIWHTGDPSGWNETIFTNQAVMIDPSGISKGAKQAASLFLLLFKYFPELRGEVVSWAANGREILINWRFKVIPQGSKTPLLVTVVDKFCFIDGRVSFRVAYFDILTLTGYLAAYLGQDQLTDFLWENFWSAEKTGGIQALPQILRTFIKGLFLWPTPPAPTGLTVQPGSGVVRLNWNAVPDAIGYNVCRSDSIQGPYDTIAVVPTTSYEDSEVNNGVPYWYIVQAKYQKWKPVPPVRNEPFAPAHHRGHRTAGAGS